MVTNTFFELVFLPLCWHMAIWFMVMAVGRALLISSARFWHRLVMTAGRGLSGEADSGEAYAAAGLEGRSPRVPLLGQVSTPPRPRGNTDGVACRACLPRPRRGRWPRRLATYS
jgi:hypothetical protein